MSTPDALTGVLLAAGKGERFDPSGVHSKLMRPLSNGEPVAVASATALLSVLPNVVAVVRPHTDELAHCLRALGCDVVVCPDAGKGIAASLVHALQYSQDARGWLIALADMPFVQPATIGMLTDAIMHGADIAVPTCQGKRGNPVAFSRRYLDELLLLEGDAGARQLLKRHPVTELPTQDQGIHLDIDTPDDLLHNTAH